MPVLNHFRTQGRHGKILGKRPLRTVQSGRGMSAHSRKLTSRMRDVDSRSGYRRIRRFLFLAGNCYARILAKLTVARC